MRIKYRLVVVKPKRLSPALGDVAYLSDFRISNDGQRVLYTLDKGSNKNFGLYSVSINGGEPIKLHNLNSLAESVYNFQISPNSQYVVYKISLLSR